MKTTSFLILILFFSLAVSAQKKLTVGILGGVNSANFYNYSVNLRKANLISYSFGADIAYLLNDNLSFRTNLMFERKGEETIIQPVDFSGNVLLGSTNFNLDYLTLNILARGSFGNKFKFIAEGGPYVGYLLSANAVGKVNNSSGSQWNPITGYNPVNQDIMSGHKSTDFGMVVGLGIEYQLNAKFAVSLTIRNSIGLTSVTKENTLNSNLKTNTISGLAGLNYKL